VPSSRALLLDAGTRQAVALARSLGRAGVHVDGGRAAAGRGVPSRLDVAMWSRWMGSGCALPGYSEPDAFGAAVRDLARSECVDAVFSVMDESIGSLRPWRAEIERYARLALAGEPGLGIALSKRATLDLASRIGIAVPPALLLENGVDEVSALAEMGTPAVVKPVVSWDRALAGDRL
jgi:hypothetical protein